MNLQLLMPFQSIFQETGTQMLKGKADINARSKCTIQNPI